MPKRSTACPATAAWLALAASLPLYVACRSSKDAPPTPPPPAAASGAPTSNAAVSVDVEHARPAGSFAPGGTYTPEECMSTYDAMNREFDTKAKADRACTRDSDCIEVSGRFCLGGCSDAIARSGRATYDAVSARLAPTCSAFMKSDCISKTPIPIPTCPMFRAKCVGGACTAVPVY